MSSSSSTTPASGCSRERTVLVWALLGAWAALVAVGVLSLCDPDWLDGATRAGRANEAFMGRFHGDNALKRGDLTTAIAEYRRALEILPDAADIHVNLGVAYVRAGDFARGRTTLERAAELGPSERTRPLIALHLGEIAERENRPDEAIAHFREALASRLRPDLPLRRLGSVLLAAGRLEEARDAFERVLAGQQDPHWLYHDMVERAREMAEYDSAAAVWMRSAGARDLTAADWERFDTTSIEQMLARDPEIAKTHNNLGFIEYRLGHRDAAIEHFERSLAIWPGNQDAVRNLRILKSTAAAG